jgi:hypothetical protein
MRYAFLLALVVTAAFAFAQDANAGPCVRDLPCVTRDAIRPPLAQTCNRTTSNSCWLYRPGWTCNPAGMENGQLIIDENACTETYWNPDGYKKFKRSRTVLERSSSVASQPKLR